MLKQTVTAQSPESMTDAIALAMAEASVFLSEKNDLRISVLELRAVRKGGYRAALEVTSLPHGSFEDVEKHSEKIEPAQQAARTEAERRETNDMAWKDRIISHFRTRKGVFLQTPSLHRAYLTEVQMIGEMTKEYSQPVPLTGLSIPNPAAITPDHERVDDKVHRTPINELVGREFIHVTHPAGEDIVLRRRALPEGPQLAPRAPKETPE